MSGYALGRIDERGWLNRVVFLETVAGVPGESFKLVIFGLSVCMAQRKVTSILGMVGAMVRHLNSLRRMERDYGWIHTLLEGDGWVLGHLFDSTPI